MMPSPDMRIDARQLIEDASDGLLVVDEHGGIRFANPAACDLLGREETQLIGTEFGHPLVQGEATEIDVLNGDERRVVEMRVATIHLDPEPASVISLRDVTARRRAEESLRSALALRDHASEIVAHELKNPLTALLGYARTLRHRGTTMEPALRDNIIERMEALVLRLVRTSDAFLTLAQLESGAAPVESTGVDVRAVLEGAAADARSNLGEPEGEITVICPARLFAQTDGEHLHHIASNLIRNALLYGRPPVVVQAYSVNGSAAGAVEISVADHGEGVPIADRGTLFDEFDRGSQGGQGPGMGLGLAIVRRLARLHHGDAWYDAEAERPTFRVRLPASGRPPLATSSSPAAVEADDPATTGQGRG